MGIELLYFDDCPNWQRTLADLKIAMSKLGLGDEVDLVPVTDQAAAEMLMFPGSPTVRVDGRDIEDDAPGSDFGLKCRIYWDQGRARGTPPQAVLEAALSRSVE